MRDASTYRGARREDAKKQAREKGQKLRDVWTGGGIRARYQPAPGSPSKHTPHQGKRETARRRQKQS